jgi:hypothetical protein
MTPFMRRVARPLAVALALFFVHAVLGAALAAREPFASLLEGQLGLAFAIVGLLATRLALWFVVVPWTLTVAAGSALEALVARRSPNRGRGRDSTHETSDPQ